MSSPPLRRIKSVEATTGYRLRLAWDRGPGAVVDLSDMISRGGVFEDLSDGGRFAAVRVGENNRVVEWPSPADDHGYPIIAIDADALFEKAARQQDDNVVAVMRKTLDGARARRAPTATKT